MQRRLALRGRKEKETYGVSSILPIVVWYFYFDLLDTCLNIKKKLQQQQQACLIIVETVHLPARADEAAVEAAAGAVAVAGAANRAGRRVGVDRIREALDPTFAN